MVKASVAAFNKQGPCRSLLQKIVKSVSKCRWHHYRHSTITIVTASVPPSLNCQNWVCFSEKPGVFRNTAICWLKLGPIISVNRNWKLCPVSFWQFRVFQFRHLAISVTTSAPALHYNLNWMLAGRCAVNAMVNIKMTLQISRFNTNQINVFSPFSILIFLHRRNIQCV